MHLSFFDSDFFDPVVYAGGLVLAAAISYYMKKLMHKPSVHPSSSLATDPAATYDFEHQSVEIDSIEHIRVCTSMKDKPLTEYRFKDVQTLYDVLKKGKELSNDGPCLGKRDGPGVGPYRWTTYSEVIKKVHLIGSGLLNMGISRNNATNIGIYSSNRNEWVISEHACYSQSFTVVSLYDSYGKESIKYILNHAEIKIIFLDTFKRLMNISEVIDELPFLELIVHFDELSGEQFERLKTLRDSKKLISFDQLLKEGENHIHPPNPPKPSDVATICYTSGTTGTPKGALISHANIIANEAAIHERQIQPHTKIDEFHPRRVELSFLPLAHMMERQAGMVVFLSGGRVGFISGDINSLVDDIQELKPTDLAMVPRLLNKIYNKVTNDLAGSTLKKFLFNWAIASKESDRKKGIYRKNTIWDKLIFNKFRGRFGGNLVRMVTGSAPISDEVMIFSKAAFGCPIPEGYGQTESTCVIACTHPLDPNLGQCGPPISCYMVKLVDVPEMGYFSKDNKGEICAKGTSIFKGYLKDEEKTRETIDADGWLHTGDIGMWLPNGTLKIVDRKKNIFKLSQGEYISPEKIESIYSRSQFVAQIFIDGNSLKDFIVGIVVPEASYLLEYCKNANIPGDFKELCQNKRVKSIILEDLQKFAKSAHLMPYEQVRNIYLHDEVFSLDNGLATPTMKVKRNEVRNKFKKTIDDLYAQTSLNTKPMTF